MSTTFTGPRLARALLAVGLALALLVAMLAAVNASSHREAPLIMEDPVADNTDVYAFVSPDDPNSVTLISNFVPFQEPGGGPNYFRFGEDVRYNIHVDNNGDAVADITYEFRFRNDIQTPDNYLYATGAIESIDDDTYNFRQLMTAWEVRDGERTELIRDAIVPPSNVGPSSTPDYASLAQEGVRPILDGAGQIFAGQRDDGFYADIAAIFDLGTLRPFAGVHPGPSNTAAGVDTFAGYNVHSIAIQVPIGELTQGDEDVIGVWSTADRRRVRVFARSSANPISRGSWTQVSRLGNPLVNEVVVPLEFKDVYNTLDPVQDADVFPTLSAPDTGSTNGDIPLVTDPILGEQIAALYGIDVPCTGENPDCQRTDLVSAFLTGIDGVNQPANVRPADILRLNTAVANSGFPNGRLVGDDVIDTALQVVAGSLRDDAPALASELTDGVDGNDVPYLNAFPYLGTPHQGYDLMNPQRVPSSG